MNTAYDEYLPFEPRSVPKQLATLNISTTAITNGYLKGLMRKEGGFFGNLHARLVIETYNSLDERFRIVELEFEGIVVAPMNLSSKVSQRSQEVSSLTCRRFVRTRDPSTTARGHTSSTGSSEVFDAI